MTSSISSLVSLSALVLSAGASLAWSQSPGRPEIPAMPFEKLSGPYAVGSLDSMWIDESREERLTKDPSDKRRVLVRFWYPAEPAPGAQPSAYIQSPEEFGSLPIFKSVAHVKTNSFDAAPVASASRRYPVLIYNHGGSWTRFSATFTTEWIASH